MSPTSPNDSQAAPVICKCGHSAEYHSNLMCIHEDAQEHFDCECNRSQKEVILASRVAELERALHTIRYEAGNTDRAQACENIIFEVDAALGGVS